MDEFRLYVNGDEILCSADTMSPLGCMLRALPADAPQVNSVTTTQSTVTLTGENFENGVLFGWAPEVCIGGQVTCDDIISVTDTEIVIDCTDQGGVPASYQD